MTWSLDNSNELSFSANILPTMKAGDVSQPLRTPSGFYLIQATDKRDTSQIVVTEFNARKIVVKVTELAWEGRNEYS